MGAEIDSPLYMATSDAAPAVETDLPLHFLGDEVEQVLAMIMGDEDEIGRISVAEGGDISEWDLLPRREVDITKEVVEETDLFAGADEPKAAPFSAPTERAFPVLTAALRRYGDEESQPSVVRIDTDKTYDGFVCERAVQELQRQVDALRDALQEHLDEHSIEAHPGFERPVKKLRRFDVLGAAGAVSKITKAKTAGDAVDAMPKVPVDVPAYAEGKVKCWRDGDAVVCSMRFQAADGTGRVATMAAKPKADVADVLGAAIRAGINPARVLGVLPDLAEAACAKRLVRDVAGAALASHRRLDVCGMADDESLNEPLLLPAGEADGRAPVAALMDVTQRAENGDKQAQKEVVKLETLASTPAGQKAVAPLMAEARARLADGKAKARAAKEHKPFLARYLDYAMCV